MVINSLTNNVASLGGAFSPARLREAFEVSLLGIMAVFGVLTLIWVVLTVFKFVFSKKNAPAPSVAKSDPVVMPVNEENNIAEDLNVAIITAAISAYISSDAELSKQYENGFKVVSFKRVRDKAHWNSKI